MKRITSKHYAINRTTFGGVTTVDFKPNVKNKTKTAPVIIESYVGDDGNIMHILENGNEISEVNFNHHWGKR